MTKRRSKCLFTFFTIVLVICLIAAFVNFTYPFTIKGNYYSYSNFASNVKLGQDICSGLRITYRADLPDFEKASNYENLYQSTVSELEEIIKGQGFKDVTVAAAGEDQIIVNVGNIVTEEDKNEVVSLIGDLSSISFSMSSDKTKAFASAQDIDTIETLNTVSDKTYHYVRVNFKASSMSKVEEATKDGGTLYILLGDQAIGTMDIENTSLNTGYLDIYSQDFVDESTANTYANRLRTGTFALKLTMLDSATVSPSYGDGANILLSIAATIFVFVCMAYLIYKFKHLGLVASYAMLFFIVISLFLLQSIPAVHVNFAGILGFLLAFTVLTDSLFTLFNKAKDGYQSDIKLFIAMKMAQKETMFRILISNIMLLAAGFVCMFMPVASIQSFGWVVFAMSFVSAFVSLVLMRLFIKMYLPFNNNDGKKCNFHKGGKNA